MKAIKIRNQQHIQQQDDWTEQYAIIMPIAKSLRVQ